MTLNVNSGGVITLQEARDLISAFKTRFPNEIKAQFLGAANIRLILDQNDCIGIRVYNGYDIKESRLSSVFVGVDSTGKDITNGIIMDRTVPCPAACDPTSSLMQ